MKPGYEFVRLAVLVIAFLWLAMATAATAAAGKSSSRIKGGRMVCSPSFQHKKLIPNAAAGNVVGGHSRRRIRHRGTRYRTASNQVIDNREDAAAVGQEKSFPDHSKPSFWLRNACHDGFVVVKEKTRVLAQHEGLDKFDPEVKLVKQSCIDTGDLQRSGASRTSSATASSQAEVMTRLYSPSQDRYICFNHRGRVRAVKSKRAERMGRLCAFYERLVPDLSAAAAVSSDGGKSAVSVYINLQSAADPDWYLGFGPNPRHKHGLKHHLGIVHTPEGYRAALPRKMPMTGSKASSSSSQRRSKKKHPTTTTKRNNANRRRRLRLRRRLRRPRLASKDVQLQVAKRCDFLFATGTYVRQDPEVARRREWSGLYHHLNRNSAKQNGGRRRHGGGAGDHRRHQQQRGQEQQQQREQSGEGRKSGVQTTKEITKTATSTITTTTTTYHPRSESLSVATPAAPFSAPPLQQQQQHAEVSRKDKNTQKLMISSQSEETAVNVPAQAAAAAEEIKVRTRPLGKKVVAAASAEKAASLALKPHASQPASSKGKEWLQQQRRRRILLEKYRRLLRKKSKHQGGASARQGSYLYLHNRKVKVPKKAPTASKQLLQ